MNDDTEALVYTLRPDRTSLWLPDHLAAAMGISRGDQLTGIQFYDRRIQQLISDRQTKAVKKP